MCSLSNYHHHQVGVMAHKALLRFRSWKNLIHCMSFYILMKCFNLYLYHNPTKPTVNAHDTYDHPFIYIGDFTYEVCARALRHATVITREFLLKMFKTNIPQPGKQSINTQTYSKDRAKGKFSFQSHQINKHNHRYFRHLTNTINLVLLWCI